MHARAVAKKNRVSPPPNFVGHVRALQRERRACWRNGGVTLGCNFVRVYEIIKVRPRIGRDHPPNLSISVGGGRETNEDSPSNCE